MATHTNRNGAFPGATAYTVPILRLMDPCALVGLTIDGEALR
jgi:hypothetical protein